MKMTFILYFDEKSQPTKIDVIIEIDKIVIQFQYSYMTYEFNDVCTYFKTPCRYFILSSVGAGI